MASRATETPIETPIMAGRERWRLSLDAVVEIESVFDAISAKLLVVTSERLAVLDRDGGARCRGAGRYQGSPKTVVLATSERSRRYRTCASEVKVEGCRIFDTRLTCPIHGPRGW